VIQTYDSTHEFLYISTKYAYAMCIKTFRKTQVKNSKKLSISVKQC